MKQDPPNRQTPKAVALHWDRQSAPRITASGTGVTAENILRIAAEHEVPLQSDPLLVEALAQIPVGDEIPQMLYVAVAEVLSFVFMLEGIDPREPRHYPAKEPAERRQW
jgi:flagellar biosynthesis protein